MDWNNLTSGLLGAIVGSIIGAIATYKAAIKGSQISIRETAKLDAERRIEQERDLKEQILSFLKQEVEMNLLLSKNIKISHAKIRFIDRAFEMARMNAKLLPKDLISLLYPVYMETTRFNTLANYDQDKVDYALGYLDKELIEQGDLIRNKIDEVQPKLLKYFST